MTGPLGLLSPHPGVSYLFAGVDVSFNGNDHDGSLWGIAHAQSTMNNAGGMGSPPPSWNSTLADSVRQVDGRLKVTYDPSFSYFNFYLCFWPLRNLSLCYLKNLTTWLEQIFERSWPLSILCFGTSPSLTILEICTILTERRMEFSSHTHATDTSDEMISAWIDTFHFRLILYR